MTLLAFFALVCAAVPALLFSKNLRVFTSPAQSESGRISVLIPARNEAGNIAGAIETALKNPEVEVLVLDDSSDDGTAEIVAAISAREPRVRLLNGAPLPAGWCGKNFACAQLAEAATHPVLLFVDADVRLAANGAGRMLRALREARADLISGIPRQEVHTFSEVLLVPLIHFVLLGFLPLGRMRQSERAAYATGCGQLMMTDAAAYRACGGHAAIRGAIHEGLALPKQFRRFRFRTDLLDATPLATCRMYRRNRDVWRGLLKNTHEGLGAPARIVPLTIVLFAGQVLPFLLLLFARNLSRAALACSVAASLFALLPRLVAWRKFRQPFASGLLHPLAILSLLAIQWVGLMRFLCGRPASWKGRVYRPHTTPST